MKGFPKDFLWGASTASHQVDGNALDQWTVWEKANAERLAQTAENRYSYLSPSNHQRQEMADPQNYISGRGVEHYTQYKEDFDLLTELHLNAFRFGIDWARLEPRSGEWDQTVLDHYRDYFAELRKRGIEPVVNLWHWTMPTWFTDKGAFEKRSNIADFEQFVRKVMAEFGHDFRYVIILNEPNVYASLSYLTGMWPPQYKRPLLTLRVYNNMIHAHRQAYHIIKKTNPEVQVGIAPNIENAQAYGGKWYNRLMPKILRYVWIWWFLDRLRGQLDFMGINYYFTTYYTWRGQRRNPAGPTNDLGWYMEPSGIEAVITDTWRRYHKPIIITENGLADAADARREWWLTETVAALRRAIAAGTNLQGYLHWSLLDNFEWADGWWPKFGLVAVDRATMRRRIRPSGRAFARLLAKNKQ